MYHFERSGGINPTTNTFQGIFLKEERDEEQEEVKMRLQNEKRKSEKWNWCLRGDNNFGRRIISDNYDITKGWSRATLQHSPPEKPTKWKQCQTNFWGVCSSAADTDSNVIDEVIFGVMWKLYNIPQ